MGNDYLIEEYSCQYGQPSVVVVEGALATPDHVIDLCKKIGATMDEDGDGQLSYVVQLRPEVGAELWSEEALRRSMKAPKTEQQEESLRRAEQLTAWEINADLALRKDPDDSFALMVKYLIQWYRESEKAGTDTAVMLVEARSDNAKLRGAIDDLIKSLEQCRRRASAAELVIKEYEKKAKEAEAG